MKKLFLDGLVGMEISDAEEAVMMEGHTPYTVPEECHVIPAIARSNTVILWQKEGRIKMADAGDPFELDDSKGVKHD
jgi:hypothetical protein